MLILRDSDITTLLTSLTTPDAHRLLHLLWATLATYTHEHSSSSSSPSSSITQHQPPRQELTTTASNTTLIMPSSDTHTTTAIKTVTLPPAGPIAGALTIFSPEGILQGLLNAAQITAFRTALASMIPFSMYCETQGCMPARDASVVVFGAGKQAEWHLRLALLIAGSRVGRVTVVNRGKAALESEGFKGVLREVRERYPGVKVSTLSREGEGDGYQERLRGVVGGADVIFCCTPAREALWPYEYLQQGGKDGSGKKRFISLIGSYRPHMHEIDSATLLSARKILVDSKENCLVESGELIDAKVGGERLVEIGELFEGGNGMAKEEAFGGWNVVFKCVGVGIMDLCMGRELLRLAGEKGVGVDVEGF